MPSALLTDLYELNMAASYLRRGMDQEATFSLFVRRLPPGRGFLVAAGLEPCLGFLEGFRFEEDELTYLGGRLGFSDDTLRAFRDRRFEGDVWAVPEGRIVLANEPLLEITAPIAVAQLVETYLLNVITFQTTIASKAARCRIAADGRDLVDFAFRRTQGVDAAMAVARSSSSSSASVVPGRTRSSRSAPRAASASMRRAAPRPSYSRRASISVVNSGLGTPSFRTASEPSGRAAAAT